MKKVKVKVSDFIRLAIPAKVDFAKNNVTKMNGNPVYPTPAVPYATYQNAAVDLETKYNAAQIGGPEQTAAQDAAELVLNDLMRKQATYVDSVADGNDTKIRSAGFEPTSATSTPSVVPDKVQNVALTHGAQSGTILKTNDKQDNVRAWVTMLMTNTNMSVAIENDMIVVTSGVDKLYIDVSTDRNREYADLTSGTKMYAETFAINTAGKGANSDRISIMVG